jgi:hypothetical protein
MQSQSGAGVVGALFGFACGVGVGLLCATKPGSETRREIADMLARGRRKGEELAEAGTEALEPQA